MSCGCLRILGFSLCVVIIVELVITISMLDNERPELGTCYQKRCYVEDIYLLNKQSPIAMRLIDVIT